MVKERGMRRVVEGESRRVKGNWDRRGGGKQRDEEGRG